MSKFPEYLEVCLDVVELNIELDRGRKSAQTMVNSLRGSIDRYAREAIAAAMIDRAIDATRLARLEKAVQAEVDKGCWSTANDGCPITQGHGYCDCHVGRLKAALQA